MTAIAETLAGWGNDLTASKIPDGVAATLRRAMLDAGGLMVAARNMGYVAAARDSVEAAGACTAIGHVGGFSAGDAALVSGIAAHGEDFDDTFEGTPVHVGAVLVPALLAVTERDGLPGEDLLRGLAAGGELACRMAVVAPTAIHRAAFHPTAVIGALAAAFGAATAKRLVPQQTACAMGIAGSMASGIIEYLAEGTSTKRLHPGWAAQSGIRAVALAERGFTGPRTVLEGEHGFFAAFAHPEIPRDFGRMTNGLGESWELEGLAFKPYACGTMAQPFIDAAIKLRAQVPDHEAVDEIVAPTAEAILHRLWEPNAEKAAPSTPYSAKFSVPYCIALGLVRGAAGLGEFTSETIQDPRLLQTAAKVRYVVDPNDPYPDNYVGAITVRLRDGTELKAAQPCLRGGRSDPLSDAELEAKFRANTEFGAWPDALADEFHACCATAFTADRPGNLARFRA
ncbi:MAG: MmgE/PrpD family protein [Boseongicola sp. SB0670_bin_30]|nr:MmgE/PrpD family protein [Boseongicola sp. SB0670_bin_30]